MYIPSTPKPGESARDYLARRSAEQAVKRGQFAEADRITKQNCDTFWPLSWFRWTLYIGEHARNDHIISQLKADEDRCNLIVDLIDSHHDRAAAQELGMMVLGLRNEIQDLRDPHNGQGHRQIKAAHYSRADALQEIHDCLLTGFEHLARPFVVA